MEQDQVVKDRAQDAEQETAEMEVEPDHTGKSLSAKMRPAVRQMGARRLQILIN